MKADRRLVDGLWLLPALAVLGLITWAAVSLWGAATHGAEWDVIGRVFEIDANGPAARAGLRVGDMLLAIDECSTAQWDVCGYHLGQPGDTTRIKFCRDGALYTTTVAAQLPTLNYRLVLLSILVVALVCCLSSLVLLLRWPEAIDVRAFYALCQTGATCLTVAALNSALVPFGPRRFQILIGMLTPVMIHFHAVFPEPHWTARLRWPLLALYGIGAGLGLLRWLYPWLSYPPIAVSQNMMHVWLLLGIGISVALAVVTYVTTHAPDVRRRIRLLVFGTVVGFGPLALLTNAPGVGFGAEPWIRWPFVIPLMGAMPIAYAVALWRYNLKDFDRALNRGLVYLVVSVLLFGVYFAALTLLYNRLPVNTMGRAALGAAVALATAATFRPLRDRAQWLIDRLFYGGWYEYRGLVEEVGRALACTLDLETLVDVLLNQVPRAMHLPGAALWLEREGKMEVVGASGSRASQAQERPPENLTAQVRMMPNRASVPMVVEDRTVGVWVLAARTDGEWGPEDERILTVIGRQAALVAHNVRLVAQLRDKVAEVEKMHRRLLAAREEERADLARELHDGVIQELVGLRYRLEALQEEEDEADQMGEVHSQVGMLVDEVRRLCSDLRPVALDQLGLAAALRAVAREVTARGLPVQVHLDDISLPDGIAISLYRIGQEALSNAWRHAAASHAAVTMFREEDEIVLIVSDDGRGFDPASVRGRDGRFGLLGMAERAEALGGHLAVESAPGRGTRVTVRCRTSAGYS